jgi:signal transduction histidine kinase
VWRALPDGERQPLLASVTPVPDRGGQLSEVVHCFRDITRLKEADEAKTLFLATASHELKTPLTVIRGFAEMLQANRLPDEESRHRAHEAILSRSVELAHVVDRLLLSSRIDAGRLSVRLEEVDVVELVAARAFGFEASTGRTVDVNVIGNPQVALADQNGLNTVLDHLIDNALKYSPEGEPVTVAVRDVTGGVQFEVTDHGIGMTEPQVAHCFDKFWQADTGDRRRFGGTGIGLYIVRSLVESMGGRILVESAAGSGTTFRVTVGVSLPSIPEPRATSTPERSIIREFMRQIGVPGEDRS